MTNKRILNISSKKKKDVMQTRTNMDANGSVGQYRNGPAIMSGNQTYIIPFAATARPALGDQGATGQPIEEAVRTATTCYMRGLKENITIQTDTGCNWRWRRICFRMRGPSLYEFENDQTLMSLLADAGMVRMATNWGNNTAGINTLYRVLFKGERNVDWRDAMTAATDNRRWDIVYDSVTNIQSGNDSGVYKVLKRWHPMNKNLVYDDDQSGSREGLRRYSVEGKRGMGDYYVVDIFSSNGSIDDQLSVEYSSTLYWHEK